MYHNHTHNSHATTTRTATTKDYPYATTHYSHDMHTLVTSPHTTPMPPHTPHMPPHTSHMSLHTTPMPPHTPHMPPHTSHVTTHYSHATTHYSHATRMPPHTTQSSSRGLVVSHRLAMRKVLGSPPGLCKGCSSPWLHTSMAVDKGLERLVHVPSRCWEATCGLG